MAYRLIIDNIESKKELDWLEEMLNKHANLKGIIKHMNEAHGQDWKLRIDGFGPDEPQHDHLKH